MVSRLVWIGKVGEMMVVENNVMRGTMRNDCIAAERDDGFLKKGC